MKRYLSARALLAAALLALACFTISASGAGAAAPTGTRAVTAAPRLPHGAKSLGAVSTAKTVSGVVVLRPRDQSALTHFIAQVTDRKSSQFHHYLTPDQFASKYGPTPESIKSVTSQLQADGLNVQVARDGMIVHFSAPAGKVETAFRTGLEKIRLANGSVGQARTGAIRLPATIAGKVAAVVGLDNVVRYHAASVLRPTKAAAATHPAAKASSFIHPAGSPQPCSDAQQAAQEFGGLTDDQIANAYGAFGLYGEGDFGAGQHVGIFELEPFATDDIQTFDECYFGTTQADDMISRLNTIAVDGGQPQGPGEGEATLDIQNVSAFAPGANIDVYEAPNTTFGSFDMYAQMVNDNVDKIISTSWGLCEQAVQEGSPGVQQAENLVFQQAAAQGQSVFSAAGDNGDNDCNAFRTTSPVDPVLSVDDPSSQPYVVAVGGTTIDNATQTPQEHVWNDGAAWGSTGGGISESWSAPSWQLGSPRSGRHHRFEQPGHRQCRGELHGHRLLPGGQPRGALPRRVPPAAGRQLAGGRVHRRNHDLRRRARLRLDDDRRHLVVGPYVGRLAGGHQRVVHLPEQRSGPRRRRIREPAPLRGRLGSDCVRGLVQRRHGRQQRPVRNLAARRAGAVRSRHRIRHGLGPRDAGADPAGQSTRAGQLPV
jgi:hypothetical protein